MTNDFDLAVYVKGDRKPTAVYNAQLIIEYEGEVVEDVFDLAIAELEVPDRIRVGDTEEVEVEVINNGPEDASGTVTLTGTVRGAVVAEFTDSFTGLPEGIVAEFEWLWTASTQGTVTWTAVVAAPADEDPDESNNTASALTRVRR